MRSARSMVDSRCAMTRLVRPLHQRLERLLHQPLRFASRAPRSPRRGSGSARPCRSRARSPGAGAGRPTARCALWPTTVSMPVRQAVDELEQVGARAARRATRSRSIRVAPSATLAATLSLNSDDVLAHQRELAAQRGDVPVGERRAVEQHAARGRLEEARQQVDQRRLAGARRADQRDRLAGAQLQVDVGRAPARCVAAVAQRHAAQLDLAARAARVEAAAALGGGCVDQVHAALERRQAARDRRRELRQVLDRRRPAAACAVMKATKPPTVSAVVAALPERDGDHRGQRARAPAPA